MAQHLREEAALVGESIDSQMIKILYSKNIDIQSFEKIEDQLIYKILFWIPNHQYKRYHELVNKRVAESVSDTEYQELLALTDLVEMAHVVRLRHIFELAKYRNVEPVVLMKELGIQHPAYA